MKIIILWILLSFSPVIVNAEDMVFVPGGVFHMGSDQGPPNESPVHRVYLDSYYIDRYPVTNAEYALFLNEMGNRKEDGKKWLDVDGPLSWWLCMIKKSKRGFVAKSGYENHPVVKVSWYGARAYARWRGKRLPTEAEWEKAARGGVEGQKCVFGNDLDASKANVAGLHRTLPVGTYPPNGLGLHDMVASVWQWCNDWYDPNYYRNSPFRNPQGPEDGSEKVIRGGSWYHKDSWSVAARGSDVPLSWSFCFVTGFRCVKNVVDPTQ